MRIVQGNSIDLSLFQFDYDLTFAAFFLNADRTIYGRYGTRSHRSDATRDVSVAGFKKTLQAVLELHGKYPANKTALAGKRGPAPRFPVPERYPSLRRFKSTIDFEGKVSRSCMHCHMIGTAERRFLRSRSQAFPDSVLYPWPLPAVLGLEFDPRTKAAVERVIAGSAAARGGFRTGDEIMALGGQPVVSLADVQWVLHTAKPPVRLNGVVTRGGERRDVELELRKGWRRSSDISWRTTSWDLRRMTTGGMVLTELAPEQRTSKGIAPGKLALYVKHVGEYGEHRTAKNSGFREGDIIIEVDGRSGRLTETELFSYGTQQKKTGDRLNVVVLRGKRRVELVLPQK